MEIFEFALVQCPSFCKYLWSHKEGEKSKKSPNFVRTENFAKSKKNSYWPGYTGLKIGVKSAETESRLKISARFQPGFSKLKLSADSGLFCFYS